MARFTRQRDGFTVPELAGKVFPWFGRMPDHLWRPLRQHVYQRDNGRCCYCGQAVELFKCHIHHVLELSRNGTNHPTNLKTLCVPCHEARHPHMQDAVKRWV